MPVKLTITGRIDANVYKAVNPDGETLKILSYEELKTGDVIDAELIEQKDPFHGRLYKLAKVHSRNVDKYMRALHTLQNVRNVGRITAERIVQALGEDAIAKILQEPAVLANVEGLKKHQVSSIISHLQLLDMTERLNSLLPTLSYRQAVILAKMVVDAGIYEFVRQDPAYLCIYCDVDPRDIGLDSGSELYSAAVVMSTINRSAANKKKAWLTYDELKSMSKLEEHELKDGIAKLKRLDVLVERDGKFTSSSIAQAYGTVLMYLNKYINLSVNQNLVKAIEERLSQYDYLNPIQKSAVLAALTRHVSVITGGPGTGKSVTIQAIHEIGRSLGLDVVVLTPTGKSAQRLADVNARTVHAHIGWDGSKPTRKLDHDLVIVDEASMLDIKVLSGLIEAISGASLCLVGDANQLPPVGCGAPFHTLVKMRDKGMHVTELTVGYRNSDEIAALAQSVLASDVQSFVSILRNGVNVKAFSYVTETELVNAMSSAYRKAYDALGLHGLYDRLLVLSPYRHAHRSKLATNSLNIILGNVLGFGDQYLSKDMKVVQVINDYEKLVMNGETGIVAWTNPYETAVNFGETVIYSDIEARAMLERALALTVHKAQGSEADTVWIVLEPNAYGIVNRQLLYTAITRAKQKVVIFGYRDALSLQNLHAIFGKPDNISLDETLYDGVRT